MASLVQSSAKNTENEGGKECSECSVRSVLIVEDHPVLIHLLDCVFVLEDYQVIHALSARAALTSIETTVHPGMLPGVVLLDLDTWLGMDRDIFLDRLRHLWWHICGTLPPLLILKTLLTDLEDIGYPALQKPFHLHALLTLCASIARTSSSLETK